MTTKLNPAIFKSYDIRGIYPKDINETNIDLIIKAIYTFFTRDLRRRSLKIVLSRDMRISSPSLFKIAKKALFSLGATVIDIGLSSTPTFYFACQRYGYDAGIQISASHNPKEYNGLKLAKRINDRLVKIGANTGMEEVKKRALSGDFYEKKSGGQVIKNKNVLKDEIDSAFSIVKPKNIKKLKVVADAANAMGILFLDEIFKRLPCEFIRMNFELDGTFPVHQPDPLQFKTLVDLQKRILTERADFGIAPDGDGDRVFFIDENGKIIPASLITSLLTKEILKDNPNEKIMFDIRYTYNAKKTCLANGGIPIISKVGHALITEHMGRKKAIFAGESSGHYFFRETGFAESSAMTILYLIKVISHENKSISQILSKFATSFESGEINFILNSSTKAEDVFNYFAKQYNNGKISWLDGIAIDFKDWRFGIRSSNTEPLIRLNVEGDSQKLINEKVSEIKKKIIKFGAKKKD